MKGRKFFQCVRNASVSTIRHTDADMRKRRLKNVYIASTLGMLQYPERSNNYCCERWVRLVCCVFGVGMMKNSPTSAGKSRGHSSTARQARNSRRCRFLNTIFSTIWDLGGKCPAASTGVTIALTISLLLHLCYCGAGFWRRAVILIESGLKCSYRADGAMLRDEHRWHSNFTTS